MALLYICHTYSSVSEIVKTRKQDVKNEWTLPPLLVIKEISSLKYDNCCIIICRDFDTSVHNLFCLHFYRWMKNMKIFVS
jgi:hypothetical protein